MKAAPPARWCWACSEEFDAESSPDLEPCQRCAERQAWAEGALLVFELPRMSPADLINHVPVGHDGMEA